ncbi:MAG: DUF6522 family protein [Gemmobacter sp.]
MTQDVVRTDEGFLVEAEILGAGFGIEPETVPGLMRRGIITSRCEEGVGEDDGRHRLTFFLEGRAFRLIVGPDGDILKRSSFDIAPRRVEQVRAAQV